jgi:hypothetical protein
VADDVFVEDGDIAASGSDVEVAEQGCADVDGQVLPEGDRADGTRERRPAHLASGRRVRHVVVLQ